MKEPRKYEGHNPLAQLAMIPMLTLIAIYAPAGRRAISAYRIGNEQLFYPLPK